MNIEQLIAIFQANAGTLCFSLIGALFLTGKSIKEHLDRDFKDKMSKGKYCVYLIGWVLGYPLLGVAVAIAYMASGNQFGSWLALQIGLTSPAILLGITNGGANLLSKDTIPTEPGQ